MRGQVLLPHANRHAAVPRCGCNGARRGPRPQQLRASPGRGTSTPAGATWRRLPSAPPSTRIWGLNNTIYPGCHPWSISDEQRSAAACSTSPIASRAKEYSSVTATPRCRSPATCTASTRQTILDLHPPFQLTCR